MSQKYHYFCCMRRYGIYDVVHGYRGALLDQVFLELNGYINAIGPFKHLHAAEFFRKNVYALGGLSVRRAEQLSLLAREKARMAGTL